MKVGIYIEKTAIDPNTFVIPIMGLSSSKSVMKPHKFSCEISKSVIIDLMRSEYDQWVAESQEDDALYNEPQDELGEAGYPDIDQVLESVELTKLMFGEYLVRELLEKLTGNNTHEDFKYWFDEIRNCVIHPNTVILTGICYSK